MPGATRLGDKCTGHDSCGARELITGSEDVYINSRPAGRVGDLYESHGCIVHLPHNDKIAVGSSTVFINGRPAGRIGDVVTIGGAVEGGSEDVEIGG